MRISRPNLIITNQPRFGYTTEIDRGNVANEKQTEPEPIGNSRDVIVAMLPVGESISREARSRTQDLKSSTRRGVEQPSNATGKNAILPNGGAKCGAVENCCSLERF